MTNDDMINQLVPGAHPIVHQFFDQAAAQGFDLRITEAYRTPQKQNDDYDQGRTKPGPIITNVKGDDPHAYHVQRRAFDVVDRVKGYNIDWPKLGALGKSLGLIWGGDFPVLVDRPHFEYHGPATVLANVTPPEGVIPMTADQLFETLYRTLVLLFKPVVRDEDWNYAYGVWKSNYQGQSTQNAVLAIVKAQYGDELAVLNNPNPATSTYEEVPGPLYRKIS